MNTQHLYTISLLFFCLPLFAQVVENGITYYGNEWIDFDRQYVKFPITEDGIYQISEANLQAANIPTDIAPKQLCLYHLGKRVPVYYPNEGVIDSSFKLLFYGEKNKSQLDKHLFSSPTDQILNPDYSLFTDTTYYYLTWFEEESNEALYTTLDNDILQYDTIINTVQQTDKQLFTDFFHKKINASNDINSQFDEAEGFAQFLINQQSFTLSPTLPAEQHATLVSIRLATNGGTHQLEVSNNGRIVEVDNFTGYRLRKYDFFANLQEGSTEVSLKGLINANDRHAIASIETTYNRIPIYNNEAITYFSLPPSDSTTQRLAVTGIDLDGANIALYNTESSTRYKGVIKADSVLFSIPPIETTRHFVLVNEKTGIQEIDNIEAVQFTNYQDQDADYIIITHPYFTNSNEDVVTEYADYRASQVGGNFKPTIIDIHQLYEQFAYGVQRHPLAIRNFAHYIKKNWSDPKYIFLIGKGRAYRYIRTAEQLQSPEKASFFLPTYGWLGSDNLLVASRDDITPIIPIGRIAATSTEEVRIYLEKIKAHESPRPQTIDQQAWTKRIIHLGGGITSREQELLKSHLLEMEIPLRENRFAADVYGFFKSDNRPNQIPVAQQITQLINEGTAVISFFGHSSATTLDFNLESPSNYNNLNRYPIFFALGCFSGQIHSDFKSIGEEFLFEPNKGGIGFYAGTGQGYISNLRTFGETYYELMSDDLYGESAGKILQQLIKQKQSGASNQMTYLLQQMTFQGDPALKIHPHTGTDVTIDASTIAIQPDILNIQLDSFEVQFDLLHLGQNYVGDWPILIEQLLPNGTKQILFDGTVDLQGFRSTISLTLPLITQQALGLNRLLITLNPEQTITEQPEEAYTNNELIIDNNQVGFPFLVASDEAIPVYPSEFAIVSDSVLTLKASTTSPFSEASRYLFELDTTMLFDSPIKQTTVLTRRGGVLTWSPNIDYMNEVFYWRIRPDTIIEGNKNWNTSSFLWDKNLSSGWNQSHYYQFLTNSLADWQLDSSRQWQFLQDAADLAVENGIFPNIQPKIIVNNNVIQSYQGGTVTAGVYVSVFDAITGEAWKNPPNGDYGSYNTIPNRTLKVFPFKTNTIEERQKLLTFLNQIPDNHTIVFQTIQNTAVDYMPENWAADSSELNTNLFQFLEQQGATQIRQTIQQTLPYTFIFQKNNPNFSLVEALSTTHTTKAILRNTIALGLLTTTIGPAQTWKELLWNLQEKEEQDETFITIKGLHTNSDTVLLYQNLRENLSLDAINAAQYPYLELSLSLKDPINRSSPQLDYWRITYEPLPDAALNTAIYWNPIQASVQRGVALNIGFTIENMQPTNMDSLLIAYQFTDKQNQSQTFYKRHAPLEGNDRLQIDEVLDTKTLVAGRYQLLVTVNPNEEQAEQTFINNIGRLTVEIEKETIPPILDVTFDEKRIFNGDIVAAQPIIEARLFDDNPYLSLKDTSLFRFFIQYPEETELRPVYFASSLLSLQNEEVDNNYISVFYTPSFEQEGIYTLYVHATDVSGNPATPYMINFQIKNENNFKNFYIFPNPMKNYGHFTYSITGTPPSNFLIEIIDIKGRLIKTITDAEFGALKVGEHKSHYTWDGKDVNGQLLPNGVYFYKINLIDNNGNEYVPKNAKELIKKLVIVR